jgi:thiamine biosynthesis lipoprotein
MNTLFSLVLLFLLNCCQNSPAPHETSFSGEALANEYLVIIGKNLNNTEKQQIDGLIKKTFGEIDQICNTRNPNSELSLLNKLRAGEIEVVSLEMYRLLKRTEDIVKATGGRFDPTSEPLQLLWEQQEHPKEQEVQALIPAIGWDKIHYYGAVFYKDHDLTMLDLEEVAKEYYADLLVKRLQEAGHFNIYVEWGEEVRISP